MDLHIGRIRIRNCSRGKSTACGCTRGPWARRNQALLAPGREAGIELKTPPEKPQDVTLYLGGREFMATRHRAPFLVVRLPKGPMEFL